MEADIVIGVPDSGLDAAIGYAQESGIRYEAGFVRNNYVGRTFIKPEQGEREASINIKLNVLRQSVAGKRIVMVDDSIVRGSTSAEHYPRAEERGGKRGACAHFFPNAPLALLFRHGHSYARRANLQPPHGG